MTVEEISSDPEIKIAAFPIHTSTLFSSVCVNIMKLSLLKENVRIQINTFPETKYLFLLR